jgi:hypothetical protein
VNPNQIFACDLAIKASELYTLATKLRNRCPQMVSHVDLLRSFAEAMNQIAREVNAS